MRTYQEAAAFLGVKSDRPVLSIRATRIIRRDDHSISLWYQSTPVVTWHDDGTATLDSGGWQTPTTKSRINDYTRARVWQQRGVWYVGSSWEGQIPSLYYDGMKIRDDGSVLEPRDPNAAESAKKKLDRWVSGYVKRYADHVCTTTERFEPGSGDCLMCQIELGTAAPQTGTLRRDGTLTDTTGKPNALGVDHILSHIAESYFVPSLLARACVHANYGGGPAIGWQMGVVRKDREWIRRDLNRYLRSLKPLLLPYVENGWTPEKEREAS